MVMFTLISGCIIVLILLIGPAFDFNYYNDSDRAVDDYENYLEDLDSEFEDIVDDYNDYGDGDSTEDEVSNNSLTTTEVKSPDGKFKVDVGVYADGTTVRKSVNNQGVTTYGFCYDYGAADGESSDEYSGFSCESGEFELFIIDSMNSDEYDLFKDSPYGEIYKTIGSYDGSNGEENYVLMWANGDLSSMLEGIGENYYEEVADSFVYLD